MQFLALTNSIYIHIPFCDNLCSYCDFTKVLNYNKFTKSYLDCLEQEVKEKYLGEKINTIYIGGGTPSALSISEIIRLFKIINTFNLENECEITFEMNIESTTKEKLEVLYNLGVNRISFGVQTFNDQILKVINRKHSKEEVFNIISDAKEVGFTNISIDLMFNLPNQTYQNLKDDLNQFLKLDIPHLSIYSLILEEKSVFHHKNIDVDYDEFDKWYYYIKEFVEKNNFIHYETSNFAKEGFNSKHNLVYWNHQSYYGFGLGASSFFTNQRCENTSSITNYLKTQNSVCEVLSDLEMMQEFMFLGLRKVQGVSINDFYDKFDADVFEIFDFENIDKNLIVIEDGLIRLSYEGLVRANDVLINFV